MAKGPQKERRKIITIHQVRRTRSNIVISYDQGNDVVTLKCRDNPMPSFDNALEALDVVFGAIAHLEKDYVEKDLRILGVNFGSKGGARTVAVLAHKSLDDAAKEFKLLTPERLLANPTEPGTYTPPLSKRHAELIAEIEEEAKAYVKGDRAQGQLPLGSDDEDGGDDAGDGEKSDKDQTNLQLEEGAKP